MPGEEAHAVACVQAAREFTSSFLYGSFDVVAGEHSTQGSCDGDATAAADHAPACHEPAGEQGAEGRACSVAGSPAAGLPARRQREKRTRMGSSVRFADDAPSGELYSVEYVETLHGLPLDASERERRAFFASLHRSKLRQRAAKGTKGERQGNWENVEPTKPVKQSAAYLLCKGGVQGARQSAQALEMELKMSEMI
jgi:hypothetical protein